MKKLLVLSADYPDLNQGRANQFVHTRNKVYVEHGYSVDVLNFATTTSYQLDGISVYSLSDMLNKSVAEYDIVIAHAANLRNHYRFLKKQMHLIKHIVFFFHGHEVMKLNQDYPTDYEFVKQKNVFKKKLIDVYDQFKFRVWRNFFKKHQAKIHLVFVSQWMKEIFLKNLAINEQEIAAFSQIIYNPVGRDFETNHYMPQSIEYDFVTIRSNLDGAKYCIDVVNQLAKANPGKKFLVIGKGKYFEYYEPASNLIWQNRTLNHQEIVDTLNQSRCALFLTRTDAQGVMACEAATFGIPIIVSDISVMHEVFDEFENVGFVNNQQALESEVRLDNIPQAVAVGRKNKKYFENQTTLKEVQLFDSLI